MKLLIAHLVFLAVCAAPVAAILFVMWVRSQDRRKASEYRASLLIESNKWPEIPEPVEPQPDTPHDALQDIRVQHDFWYKECMRLQTEWMWAFRSGDTLALHQLEGQICVAEHRFHQEDLRLRLYIETASPQKQEDR